MTLTGRNIAVSIGGSPDLAKLGFPAREVQRALFSICGALIRAGARVSYGGDLRAGGFTIQMYRHLAGAYADRDTRPFCHYLAEPALRRVGFADLTVALRESQSVTDVMAFLNGERLPIRASADTIIVGEKTRRMSIKNAAEFAGWLESSPPATPSDAYRFMRRAQSQDTHARVAMGGRMGIKGYADDTYEGQMPGIAEEALLTLGEGKPFVPLAAYGGATRDVAIELGLLDPRERTPRGPQLASYAGAMAQVAAVKSRIPSFCADDLANLARTERLETLADLTVSTIVKWLSGNSMSGTA